MDWSQDMWILKGGKLESKYCPLIRTEIKVGTPILIYVFILPCMKVKLIFICIIHKARI